MNDANQPLGQEWVTLQNNHEHYERGAVLLGLLVLYLSR